MTEKKTEPDFLGKDGCLRCGICGKRKQIKVNFMGRERTVNCLCDCEIKERQAREEQIRREEVQRDLYRRKSIGLKDRRFWEWRFENDDGSNDKMLIARQYVEHWGGNESKKCWPSSYGAGGNRKEFFCRVYCKCSVGTGRARDDDEFLPDLK